jgi:hypothetical protein
LIFAIGQGFNPLHLRGSEIALGSAFLVALTGMLVLWRWELVGGVMVVAGMVGFYAINFAATGRWPGGWVFPICFLPGILALASWWTAPPAKLPSRFRGKNGEAENGTGPVLVR